MRNRPPPIGGGPALLRLQHGHRGRDAASPPTRGQQGARSRRTARLRVRRFRPRWPRCAGQMRRPAQRYVLIGNQVRLRFNGCSPASIRAAMSATGPQPGDLVRVAGEQDREPAAEWLRVRTSPGVVTRIISSVSDRGAAAVDVDDRAVDVAGRRGREERDDVGQLVHVSDADRAESSWRTPWPSPTSAPLPGSTSDRERPR